MEDMTCAQCGQQTHDDTSELWEDVYSDGALRRFCFDCAPPDYPHDEPTFCGIGYDI